MGSNKMGSDKLAELLKYTACDVADALLKLEVPGAGYLPDITPLNTSAKVVAPATTVFFIPRSSPSFPASTAASSNGDVSAPDNGPIASNIPAGAIYSDLIEPGTIAVLSQPKGASTATMGSVHAVRIATIGAKGVLVDGRVRDVGHLKDGLDLPIWCKSTSIVATKGECKVHAINVPIEVGRTKVIPGDIIFLDASDNGAVCIPIGIMDQVLEMLPKMKEADNNMMADVVQGMSVADAGKKHNK